MLLSHTNDKVDGYNTRVRSRRQQPKAQKELKYMYICVCGLAFLPPLLSW